MEYLDILKISDIVVKVRKVYKKAVVDGPIVNKVTFYRPIIYWMGFSSR